MKKFTLNILIQMVITLNNGIDNITIFTYLNQIHNQPVSAIYTFHNSHSEKYTAIKKPQNHDKNSTKNLWKIEGIDIDALYLIIIEIKEGKGKHIKE